MISISYSVLFFVMTLGLMVVQPSKGQAELAIHDENKEPTSIEHIGTWTIAGTANDRSGLKGTLENGTPLNRFGGLSAIDFDPTTGTFWAASDRGPDDGAVSWPCRIHELRLDIDANGVAGEIIKTVLLRDSSGKTFPGRSDQIVASETSAIRLDPEAIRVSGDAFFISDEYGPSVLRFDRTGQLLGEVEVPRNFLVTRPAADEKVEISQNQTGRVTNRGLESLAVAGSDHHLIALLQSPLLQDSERLSDGKLNGLNCRMAVYDAACHPTKQLTYHLESGSNKLNEILAIDEHQFLVIERDGKSGAKSAFKKIMQINIANATDVSSIEQLPIEELPVTIQPVSKTEFIDLLDARYDLAGERFPEKIEGLCWGPDLEDGRKSLVVAVDNDFVAENESLIYVFAVTKEALAPTMQRVAGK